MGKSQRTKGASYERELATQLTTYFGSAIKRNIGQARDGGNDLDVPPLVIEAKRRKSLKTIMGWLAQAKRAVTAREVRDFENHRTSDPLYPIVIAREDNSRSIAILYLDDFLTLAGPELRSEFRARARKG